MLREECIVQDPTLWIVSGFLPGHALWINGSQDVAQVVIYFVISIVRYAFIFRLGDKPIDLILQAIHFTL